MERLAALSAQEYRNERFEARYLVQAAAQIYIDVANHLISSEGWRVPSDFRDAFTVLQEQGMLGIELSDRLPALAGLRNRLVHLYTEVDDDKVHEAIANGLADLLAFAAETARLVESSAG